MCVEECFKTAVGRAPTRRASQVKHTEKVAFVTMDVPPGHPAAGVDVIVGRSSVGKQFDEVRRCRGRESAEDQ